MVAGSFNANGVHVHSVVYNTTESTRYPTLPLEPDSGAPVAEIAVDTIRRLGSRLTGGAAPRMLRHRPGPTEREVRFRVA